MRLPYVPEQPNPPASSDSNSDSAILSRVLARRGGTLLPLDRALLHSPPVADGWNAFLGSIRSGTLLRASEREAIICRIAVLNRAWFEWEQHLPLLLETGEVSEEGVGRIGDVRSFGPGDGGKDGLGERFVAVLRYTDAMTLGVVVSEEIFAGVRQLFDEREVVELTATVAAYNCVSRFLVALDVGEMAQKYGVDGVSSSTDQR